MNKKMSGVYIIHYLRYGSVKNQPDPSRFLLWMMKKIIKKRNITDEQIDKLAKVMTIELGWWQDRNWIHARSFNQLLETPIPDGFDAKQHPLQPEQIRTKAVA